MKYHNLISESCIRNRNGMFIFLIKEQIHNLIKILLTYQIAAYNNNITKELKTNIKTDTSREQPRFRE